MDYFQALNYFFQFAQFRNLPASARLTYLAILHKWNGFRRAPSFALSDRELSQLTGLGIGRTITQAKRLLKNVGLIDFKSTTHGTTYFFKEIGGTHQITPNGSHPTTKNPHSGFISNTEESTIKKEEERKGVREEAENFSF